MSEMLAVVRGISQVLANTYHGAYDPRTGEKIKVGLKRDEEVPHTEHQLLDGFKVRFHGNKLVITYQADVDLKHLHRVDYEREVEEIYANIVKYLQTEYKKHTGRSLRLTEEGECDILMQSVSRKRNFVQCVKHYKINNIKGEPNPYDDGEDLVRDATKRFIAMGKNNTPF